jgi:hypothetical protein
VAQREKQKAITALKEGEEDEIGDDELAHDEEDEKKIYRRVKKQVN